MQRTANPSTPVRFRPQPPFEKENLNKIRKAEINAVLTNSRIYDCGEKKGFLGANINIALKDKTLKKYLMEEILR